MSLITPHLDLTYEVSPGEPNVYFLDSASTFEQSNFVMKGHAPVPSTLNENDILVIDLYVTEDGSLPANNGPVKIEHFVELGNLNYGLEEFTIEVFIYDQTNQASLLKGRGDVRNTDAREIGKPIESQG